MSCPKYRNKKDNNTFDKLLEIRLLNSNLNNDMNNKKFKNYRIDNPYYEKGHKSSEYRPVDYPVFGGYHQITNSTYLNPNISPYSRDF